MNLSRIASILNDLRLANECEAAAEMDLADAEANVAFYERKRDIMAARLRETKRACQDVCDKLGEVITQETAAPLMLTAEVIDNGTR